MLARRTQTNEPARCATLLPALALLPPPLALIEVGASAGLTLLFDRYSYDFGGHRIDGPRPPSDPRCAARPAGRCRCRTAFPRSPGGPGLTSTRSTSPTMTTSTGCSAWSGPVKATARGGSPTRRDRPPRPSVVHRGDLLTDLPALAAQAPADATLVVYHSAVLAYVSPDDRQRFAAAVGRRGLAIQRGSRRAARPAHTALPGRAIRARPRRPHAAGSRRRSRGMASLAAWPGPLACPAGGPRRPVVIPVSRRCPRSSG